MLRYVLPNNGTGTNGRSGANAYIGQQHRARADQTGLADLNTAAQYNARCDVRPILHDAVMIDNRTMVDDHPVADNAARSQH